MALALNNLQKLIYHETKKPNLKKVIGEIIVRKNIKEILN